MLNRQFYKPGLLPQTGAAEKVQLPKAGAPKDAELIELSADELPAVCPHASMPLWASHPRVFLEAANGNEAMCPYCGTRYRLRHDASVRDHQFGLRNLHQHRQHGVECESEEPGRARSSGDKRRDFANLSADAFSNTTLELITRWLRRDRI